MKQHVLTIVGSMRPMSGKKLDERFLSRNGNQNLKH